MSFLKLQIKIHFPLPLLVNSKWCGLVSGVSMDPLKIPLELLHLTSHILGIFTPGCPACSCSCAEASVVHQVPTALTTALEFCHASVNRCQESAPEYTFSFSLFWLGFCLGILVTIFVFVLLFRSQRQPERLELVNPRQLRELGLI